MRTARTRNAAQSGQAIIELAIATPVLLGLLLLCCLCHVTLLFWGLRKIEFELVETSGPAVFVPVARRFVEELLMDQREQ